MSTRAEWKEAVLRNYRAGRKRLRSAVVAARAKWYDPTSAFASYRNTLGGLTPYELLRQYKEAGYPEEIGVEDAELLEMGVEDAELLKEAVEVVEAARAAAAAEDAADAAAAAAVKRRGRSLATRRNRPVAKNKMPSEENMLQRFEGRSRRRSRNLRTRSVNRK